MSDKSIETEKSLYMSKKFKGVKKKHLTDEYTFGIMIEVKD